MTEQRAIGIAGTGLIGGSIGLRSRALGWRVLGYDTQAASAQTALRLNAIDEIVSHDALFERSDIVVIASHVLPTINELERLKPSLAARPSLILDVASVKAPVVRAAASLPNFVASHPMAGGEGSGAQAASACTFVSKPWLYVPSSDAQLNERASSFISALGAQPVAVDAQEHDAIVALTSHAVQAIASLFAARLRDRGSPADLEPFCGPTAREMLRLSRSSLPMWSDIFQVNRANLALELRALSQDLQQFAQAIEQGDLAQVEAVFQKAT